MNHEPTRICVCGHTKHEHDWGEAIYRPSEGNVWCHYYYAADKTECPCMNFVLAREENPKPHKDLASVDGLIPGNEGGTGGGFAASLKGNRG